MLAQCARLLAFYASLVYNLWKHKITTAKPNMSKNSTMNFFINSREKILPAQKLSILLQRKSTALYKKGSYFFFQKSQK